MHGVTTFGDSAVVVRGRIKTLPGSQWAAGRAYNEIIKKVFDERGIEIPYPHRTIYWGEDKHGEVSPLRIMKERAEEEGEAPALKRSEERRVGKECGSTVRSRGSTDHEKQQKKEVMHVDRPRRKNKRR